MKFTIAFALAAMLVALSASAASACPSCPEGMVTVNVDLNVAGQNCGWPPATDWQKFTMAEAGTYDVYGYVRRGGDGSCETKEEFFASIGGTSGPVLPDGVCGVSETLLALGTFDLVTGYKMNTVTMTSSAPDCGDGYWTKNDVQIVRLCIAKTPPSAPEFPFPALAALSVLAAIPAAAFVSRKR